MGKILNWNELKEAVDRLKADGKKIVFTNGCFDIIHIGHIRCLKEAKALGDVLVVGLNSDRSVSLIKSNRPINPQNHRAEILSSLEMVDYVILFDEETPYELIKLLQPDVLVKGGDWKKEDIVGSDIAKKTYSLPYVKDISTSGIIERIKRL
ncbi:MAG: D-glycero-beta-D-manno-heptose 1-phosphate adenylyltransferase [Nitrospirae bacterium CG_4_10_14_0_8_um_filter_41_23]|nr:MAG: D-glycero-beta-D-manno-heptose 1-phosphate adenylyltransferase [Nitrospirae bacterium CG11_big_fil_rev_8_21_14_0_20_41_14]PIV44824.1 MAG: D-glycero-beta-D-manno-heptose 1-phosphate adenylyltransferase [Nitrospirae bacterium CG02_land_8_20_14_3_00_41_53]PIW86572.1 MAG: D-glycero-beta-D-manno-heptose 1-phosphate adenylyltransferase [Nitrospirae bacterium CG_4_8_14_3_um_filter_41_47]PIY86683.1 MAG: D-glycero-beta-D-manno-heptose 1-phosphate adenylyltransferase [Nitrospirae bacterium CG_4_10